MSARSEVPAHRVRALNQSPVNPAGRHVLYWMTAFRRTHANFSLDRAVEWARELDCPLLVLEALRVDYPWASDRLHTVVMAGMRDNQERLTHAGVRSLPYVERSAGEGRGLLEALAASAGVVVTDDAPVFFLPAMLRSVASRLEVRLEAVDSNGLVPLSVLDREKSTAHAFRRVLQAGLREWLTERPRQDPLRRLPSGPPARVPAAVLRRWPMARPDWLTDPHSLARLPIDHDVAPGVTPGGPRAAVRRWRDFLFERLDCYESRRNHPDDDATSGLSAALHFGHLSVHQIFRELAAAEDWTPDRLGAKAAGRRQGWWGMSGSAEAFLDQVITWRELGYQFCARRPDHELYSSLPDWARTTLDEHRGDPRPFLYTRQEFDEARTHDELWNAAQNQLRREGRLHNYLRMLWGKKILEWSATPEQALDTMFHLNNRYALDGRDPNSSSGIAWVLGRFDRAWGPERPVFGKIRFMASANTRRKLRLKEYLRRYAVTRGCAASAPSDEDPGSSGPPGTPDRASRRGA